MKVIFLAGGFGTRLAEYTELIPKPMVSIGGKPILWHIMKTYSKFGHNDFYAALGYKSEVVKDYFVKYHTLNSDFTVSLKNGKISRSEVDDLDWKVTLVDTGIDTMTGGRLKRMREFIGNETFMMTYGDGLSNINVDKLIDFHRSHKKMVTVTTVRPPARFGELVLEGDIVREFNEKPQLRDGWINGGFFVFEPGIFDFIKGDESVLEKEPLERAAFEGQMMAYRHEGFWQCMDTKRDKDHLEELFRSGSPPW